MSVGWKIRDDYVLTFDSTIPEIMLLKKILLLLSQTILEVMHSIFCQIYIILFGSVCLGSIKFI